MVAAYYVGLVADAGLLGRGQLVDRNAGAFSLASDLSESSRTTLRCSSRPPMAQAWPLILSSGLKIVYDLLARFHKKPTERILQASTTQRVSPTFVM